MVIIRNSDKARVLCCVKEVFRMKLGILGAGNIGGMMARTVRMMNEAGIGDVELYAVAARKFEKAEAFAQANGVKKAFGSYEDMLSDPELDLVYVATPHSHHAEHAKLCIEHGKVALVEKAFTANAGQAREVLALAKESAAMTAMVSAMALAKVPAKVPAKVRVLVTALAKVLATALAKVPAKALEPAPTTRKLAYTRSKPSMWMKPTKATRP